MPVENPGETSGGDSTTAPPTVSGTPGGHTDVAPVGTGEPVEEGSTEAAPEIEETPGGHTDVEPEGTGAVELDQSATATGPSVVQEAHSDVAPRAEGGPDEAAAGSTATLPTVDATPVEDDQDATSESRTGALPEVSATPDPKSYKSSGTS